jgi:hypothetical protein
MPEMDGFAFLDGCMRWPSSVSCTCPSRETGAKHHAPCQGGHGGGKQAGALAKAQATAQRRDRGVVCAALELPYATSSDGKISSLVVIFSLTWSRQETRPESRNSNCISGSTKYDRRAYRSSTQTFRGRSAHYCIERISSRSWNDDWKLSSSW